MWVNKDIFLILITVSQQAQYTSLYVSNTPSWQSYLKENLSRCLTFLQSKASHVKQTINQNFKFINKCCIILAQFMCKDTIHELSVPASVTTNHPCGYLKVWVTKNSFHNYPSKLIFQFFVEVPLIFVINVTVHHLNMLHWNHGTECMLDYISVGHKLSVGHGNRYCGPEDGLNFYTSRSASLAVAATFFPNVKMRSFVASHQVMVHGVVQMHQFQSYIYYLGGTGKHINLSSSPFLFQTIYGVKHNWKYSFTAVTGPGYVINAKTSASLSLCRNMEYVHLHDGPSKMYPLLLIIGKYSHQAFSVNTTNITLTQTFSRGPRMYIEFSIEEGNTSVSKLDSSCKLRLDSEIISDAVYTKTIYVPDKGLHYNFPCTSDYGLTQCIWVFSATYPQKWLNMTLQTMDLMALNSYGCSSGIFAVYDKEYDVKYRNEIFQTCFDYQHHLQRSLVSSGTHLSIILISYHQSSNTALEAIIAPSSCQGYFMYLPLYSVELIVETAKDTYTVVDYQTRALITWQYGCFLIQYRTLIKLKETRVLVLHPKGSEVTINFFEPFTSPTCKRTVIASDFQDLPIYPRIMNFDEDTYYNTSIFPDELSVKVPTTNWQGTDCLFYEASFDIRVESKCKHLQTIVMEEQDSGHSSVSSNHHKHMSSGFCRDASVNGDRSLQAGTLKSHCEEFHIKRMNPTRTLWINSKLPCSGDRIIISDQCFMRWEALSKLGPLQPRCTEDYKMACSVAIKIHLTGQNCSLTCIKHTRFVVREEAVPNVEYSFSFKSPDIVIHIPHSLSRKVVFGIYSMLSMQCQCEIKLHAHLNPYLWLTRKPHPYQHSKFNFSLGNRKFVLFDLTTYSWDKAESLCKLNHTGHLWTISDMDELYKVLNKYIFLIRKYSSGIGYLYSRVMFVGLKNNQVFICVLYLLLLVLYQLSLFFSM